MMDLRLLSRIDEELDSSEVAALCFLCRDVLNRKRLETVQDGRDLFLRLQEKSLLEDHYFLSQLLNVIGRLDLLRLLETDSGQPEQTAHTQTDACPALSQYRRMLYKVSEDITKENLTKIKFLLSDKLPRGRLDPCTTALEVLCEMERHGLLTEDRLGELQRTLEECDTQLAHTVRQHREARGSLSRQEYSVQPISNQEQQLRSPQSLQSLSISETRPNRERGQSIRLFSDALMESPPWSDQVTTSTMQSWKTSEMEHYSMTCNPRGMCLIINNHHFMGLSGLADRPGTEQDEKALHNVFSRLGFKVEVCSDLTEKTLLEAVKELGARSHVQADALVVCVLSHGEKGCVFGTDGGGVPIRSLTQPFTSEQCPSLMGKPKLFFIQACQGKGFLGGTLLPTSIRQREGQGRYEADAGAIESIPWDADFLIGMATVEEYKSFRNTKEGSIYIQELCKQLEWGAERGEDILSVLTCVNREVSRGVYKDSKQMPEPKYTLTKKLFLPYF